MSGHIVIIYYAYTKYMCQNKYFTIFDFSSHRLTLMGFCLTLIFQVVTPDPVSLSLNPDSSQYQLRRQIQAVSRNVLEGNVWWMEKVGK